VYFQQRTANMSNLSLAVSLSEYAVSETIFCLSY